MEKIKPKVIVQQHSQQQPKAETATNVPRPEPIMKWLPEAKEAQVKTQPATKSTTSYTHHEHKAIKPITIGGFPVYLGGRSYIPKNVIYSMDIVCPLNGNMPEVDFGRKITLVSCALQDYGGVPKEWPAFINHIVKSIQAGKKVLGYCTGGHGRTGTFAASLLAVMEPAIPDPIAEIRKRYCKKAVETINQADAVFAFRGTLAPDSYLKELQSKFSSSFHNGSSWGDTWGDWGDAEDPKEKLSLDKFNKFGGQSKQQQVPQPSASKTDHEYQLWSPELGRYIDESEIEEAWHEVQAGNALGETNKGEQAE